jgi:hypothetical protein
VGWCVDHEFARVLDLQWHERVSAKEKERERAREGGGGVVGRERAKERKSERARERESERARIQSVCVRVDLR